MQITSVVVLQELLAKLKIARTEHTLMMAITALSPGIPISWNRSLQQVLHVLSKLPWLGRLPSLYFDIWCELSIWDNTLAPSLTAIKKV